MNQYQIKTICRNYAVPTPERAIKFFENSKNDAFLKQFIVNYEFVWVKSYGNWHLCPKQTPFYPLRDIYGQHIVYYDLIVPCINMSELLNTMKAFAIKKNGKFSIQFTPLQSVRLSYSDELFVHYNENIQDGILDLVMELIEKTDFINHKSYENQN